MDIGFLLWLQGIRESLPSVVESVFVAISAIAVSKALIVVPCLLFWCLDKRAGRYVLFTFTVGSVLNQLVKNTVCWYRPWLRSAAVHPAKGALADATGYSFPSGHTQSVVNIFGAVGWYYHKRWPWLNAFCWVFVALVAFSRNFLGVHTPQDVVVALLEGIVVLWAVMRLLDWVDKKDGRDARLLTVGLAATVAYVAYVVLKPYPVDYGNAGALLVDPVAMQVDCFKSVGVFAGGLVGWSLEKRFVAFEVDPKELGWRGILLRLVVGLVIVGLLHVGAGLVSRVLADARVVELIKNFVTALAAVYVAPLAFTATERRLGWYKGREAL